MQKLEKIAFFTILYVVQTYTTIALGMKRAKKIPARTEPEFLLKLSGLYRAEPKRATKSSARANLFLEKYKYSNINIVRTLKYLHIYHFGKVNFAYFYIKIFISIWLAEPYELMTVWLEPKTDHRALSSQRNPA